MSFPYLTFLMVFRTSQRTLKLMIRAFKLLQNPASSLKGSYRRNKWWDLNSNLGICGFITSQLGTTG